MNAIATRADVYSRVTAKIIADLEQGVRPWLKPWNAEHAAGRISRPLCASGQAYMRAKRKFLLGTLSRPTRTSSGKGGGMMDLTTIGTTTWRQAGGARQAAWRG
jgi:antirestriction protein ArdC